MLTINLLGKGSVFYHEECISDKLSSKLIALLCLLVLNRGRDMSKEKIISYLWPDSNDEAAKSNLRFNLWTIKRIIPQTEDGEDFIISGKDYCRINEKYPYRCDRTQLDCFKTSQCEKTEDLIKLKELFKGDFLEGLYLRNCDEFNEMILFERVVCQNKQVEVLEKLVSHYEQQEHFEEELQILNEVASIEPYNEKFAYRIIELYGKLGNRTAAINYYKNFEIVLRRNLNTSPNHDLKLLYKELMESPGCLIPEQKRQEQIQRKEIRIDISGLKEIPYFGLVNILDAIMKQSEKDFIFELEASDIRDITYIYSGFGLEYKKLNPEFSSETGHVPPARIAFAFQRLLEHVSRHYDVIIQVTDFKEMDQISKKMIQYLEKLESCSLKIEKQS